MKDYNIGDKVWVAECGKKDINKICPICFGKLELKLILGNGVEVMVPCDLCSRHGWEPPKGRVVEYEYVAEPVQMVITEIRSNTTCAGDNKRYYSGHTELDSENTFDTIEEATARCAVLVAKQQDESLSAHDVKKEQFKTYAYNVGYHLRQLEHIQNQIQYHKRMARICMSRAKSQDGMTECKRMIEVHDKSQAVGEFLEWLGNVKKYTICRQRTDDEVANNIRHTGGRPTFAGGDFVPVPTISERILAEYFEIDLNKFEAETRALIKSKKNREK